MTMNVLVNDFVGGHVRVLIGVSGPGIRALVLSSLSQRFALSLHSALLSFSSLDLGSSGCGRYWCAPRLDLVVPHNVILVHLV